VEATPSLVPVERRCCDIASHVSCAPHAYSGRLPTHLILNNWILFDNACDNYYWDTAVSKQSDEYRTVYEATMAPPLTWIDCPEMKDPSAEAKKT
jgi:hypothetical protein